MFDLRVPPSLAELPGRIHVLADDLSPEALAKQEREAWQRQNKQRLNRESYARNQAVTNERRRARYLELKGK